MRLSNIQNKIATIGKFLETRTIKVIGLLSKRMVRAFIGESGLAVYFRSRIWMEDPGFNIYVRLQHQNLPISKIISTAINSLFLNFVCVGLCFRYCHYRHYFIEAQE